MAPAMGIRKTHFDAVAIQGFPLLGMGICEQSYDFCADLCGIGHGNHTETELSIWHKREMEAVHTGIDLLHAPFLSQYFSTCGQYIQSFYLFQVLVEGQYEV